MAMEILEPAIWESLPKDLLHLVLAHLDVPGISQLRQLSKHWKREVDTIGSDFSRALESTAYPNMFGLVSWKDPGDFYCQVFDVKLNQVYGFDIHVADDYCITPGATDGGLVCFVSEQTRKPLRVFVVNPLTKQTKELPPLIDMRGNKRKCTVQPTMVHLSLDRETKSYKVFVVGYMQIGERGLFAQIYDSNTTQWILVGPELQSCGRVLGVKYDWDEDHEYYSGERQGPVVYEFAEHQLQHYGADDIAQGPLVKSYALLSERLFVLHYESRQGPASLSHPVCFVISEYHLPKNATVWVKVETHSCCPFDHWLEGTDHYNVSIHAGNRFLLIGKVNEKYEYEWLYDLSTFKWQRLPAVQHCDNGPLDLMCEISWNAIP